MYHTFVNMIIKDLKLVFRNKQLIFVCFVLPFILFFLFSYIFSGGMEKRQKIEPMKLAIVDKENSALTNMLVESFKDNKAFSEYFQMEAYDRYENAEDVFNKGEVTGILILPKDFSRSIYYFENYPVTLIINGNSYLKMEILKNIMNSYSKFISGVESGVSAFNKYIYKLNIPKDEKKKLNERISINLVSTALGRGKIFDFNKIEEVPSSSSETYFLISMIILFLMYIGLTSGNLMVYERENRNIGRLKVTPCPVSFIILSKIISFVIFSFIFIFIFTIPIIFTKKIYIGMGISNILLFLLIVIWFIISFSVFMGCIFKEEELMLFGNLLIFFLALLGGSFIPIYLMPYAIQNIAKITPNYWMIKGILFLLNSYTLKDILPTVVLFIFLSLIFVILASNILERGKSNE